MQIRLTFPTVAGGRDVDVTTAIGTPVRAVLTDLLARLGPALLVGPDDELWCQGRRLGSSAVVGDPPLTEGAVITAQPPEQSPPEYYGLELRVVGGPDAGAVHVLRPGALRIGRAADADVRIDDPRVEHSHARLEVGQQEVAFYAERPATIDQEPVDAAGTRLYPGDVIRIGDTSLCLTVDEDDAVVTEADHTGLLSIVRPPRLLPYAPPVEIRLPAEPARARTARLLPARGHRRGHLQFERQTAEAGRRLHNALRAEALGRRQQAPDPAELMLRALGPRAGLWERRVGDPDFLHVRLGTADLPSHVSVISSRDGVVSVDLQAVPAVPVSVSLPGSGVLGLTGPRTRLSALSRWLVAQLAGLHGPRNLELTVLADTATAPGWRWTRWLPHLRPGSGQNCTMLLGLDPDQLTHRLAELGHLLDRRAEALNRLGGVRSWAGSTSVVVLDLAADRYELPELRRIIGEGPGLGVHLVLLASEPAALPAGCGAVLALSGNRQAKLRLSGHGQRGADGTTLDSLIADGVPPSWCERFARAMAPLREADPAEPASLPDSARLLELLRLDRPTSDQIVVGWKTRGRSERAVIGAGANGPVTVDLVADGPHALVAGTTGSGKTELLITLVASFALANRPDELNFLLVDDEGGAKFFGTRLLPHVVEIISALDRRSADRTLEQLAAELRRRERLLAEAGCTNLTEYRSAGAPRGPLARLVIVVDEFARLVQDLPDLVSGLVDLGRRGRSLGVHLILATQRPGGMVSTEIRAHTNLRIALRLADPSESRDVIDAPDAAQIGHVPGRGYLRTGAGPLVAFQAARVGGRPVPGEGGRIMVQESDWRRLGDPLPVPPPSDDDLTTDLSLLVTAVRGAAGQLGLTAPTPWLPPLPDVVLADSLPPRPGTVPIGLADRPDRQTHEPFGLTLGDGGTAVVGRPFSGMTSTLTTIAGMVGRDYDPSEVELYVIDCGMDEGLGPLERLPHVRSVVTRKQTAQTGQLLASLTRELEDRQTAAAHPRPAILLLLYSWERFTDQHDEERIEAVRRLLKEGPAVGIQAVLSGGRSLLTGRMEALLPDRIVLRLDDPSDYSAAGVKPRLVPERMPPGRGFTSVDGSMVEVQIAAPDPGIGAGRH